MAAKQRYEYRVRYRRQWWASRQGRIFQRHQSVERFLKKITSPGPYAPLEELTIERRVVPEWGDEVDLMADEWTP